MSDLFKMYAQENLSPGTPHHPEEVYDWAAEEIRTLRQQHEQAQARVAELLTFIREAEDNGTVESELARILSEDNSEAWLLRKQAEAVEAVRDSIKEQYPLEPFGDLDEYVIAGMKEVYTYVEKSAQRLRQQADEAERAGGEK